MATSPISLDPPVPPGDVEALRQYFPHTDDRIYLNHAATSLLSTAVRDAMQAHLAQRHGATPEAQIDDFEGLARFDHERS